MSMVEEGNDRRGDSLRDSPFTEPVVHSTALIKKLEKEMREAAKALEFEKAAKLRDRITRMRNLP